MPQKINMIGQRFRRLTVLSESPARQAKKIMWICRCDCGTVTSVDGAALRRGNTKSCGCERREVSAKKARTHGGTGSPTYSVWESMKRRCFSKGDKSYHKYGGRGITVCERWLSFENFLHDMGERPAGHWIDRIDNTRGYEHGNCRWATPRDQQQNRTNNKMLTFMGATKTQSQWASEYGLADNTLSRRLKRGWSIERALTERRSA